jgi:hypothetical protein
MVPSAKQGVGVRTLLTRLVYSFPPFPATAAELSEEGVWPVQLVDNNDAPFPVELSTQFEPDGLLKENDE